MIVTLSDSLDNGRPYVTEGNRDDIRGISYIAELEERAKGSRDRVTVIVLYDAHMDEHGCEAVEIRGEYALSGNRDGGRPLGVSYS